MRSGASRRQRRRSVLDMTVDDAHRHLAKFRRSIRDFCANNLPEALREKVMRGSHLEKEDYLAWQRLLYSGGWMGGHWPKAYGGSDWSLAERYIFEDETGKAGAPWLIPHGVHYLAPVIYTFGNDQQKRRFLPPILRGEEWWAQGYSEPSAGSDLAALSTSARREGDQYVVNGQKIWTSFAQWADWIFCLVRTGGGNRPQEGISFLLIDLQSPGITIRPIETFDRETHVNEVFFDDVKVPIANLVGEEGKGWSYAKFLLANERVTSAEIGRKKRQLLHIKQIAHSTAIDGLPIGQCSWAQAAIAELEIAVTTLDSLIMTELLTGDGGSSATAMVKIRAAEVEQALTELWMRLMSRSGAAFSETVSAQHAAGGKSSSSERTGAMREYLYYRASTIYGGSNEIQRNILTKLMGLQ
jgi:alkylation response protein AidB-like acyl-CoA dehydrogenase